MAKEIVKFVTIEGGHDTDDRTYGFSSNNVIDESKVVETRDYRLHRSKKISKL